MVLIWPLDTKQLTNALLVVELTLNIAQRDSQAVTNKRKLNLPRDLRWVVKRTAHVYSQVHAGKKFKADVSCISLANKLL